MILALLFSCAAAAIGIAAVYAYKLGNEHVFRLALGTLFGFAAVSTLTYVIDIVLPMSAGLLWTETALVTAGAAALAWQHRESFKQATFNKVAVGIFLSTLALSLIISPKLLISEDGGYSTGIINAYGDVAWHTANITMFAEGQTVPPENPIFAGERLTYPFMTNYASALLIVGGASLPASINIPAVILIPILLTLLYYFVFRYTNARSAGVIAVLLFLFGGATLGFFRIGQDFQEAGVSLVEFLTHLPARDYSGVGTDQNGFHFLNPVTTLLLPQRSFLFGIPLALAILTLLRPTRDKRDEEFIAAGVLSGLVPLFHGHTVLALIPAIIGLFFIKPKIHQWLLFVLPALIIGFPGVLYYIRGESEAGAFFRLAPGWMAGDRNLIAYWMQNTGLLIPVVILGLFTKHVNQNLKAIALSGLILFTAANTWLFAPWAWDNFKLFVYFFLFSLPITAYLAAYLWREYKMIAVRAIVVLALAFHMTSAALDIWKLALPTARIWGEWDKQAVAAATMIQAQTRPGDIILTAPSHNSAVVLAGRPRYLGFSAHVWSHGGNPWGREKAIAEYYKGSIHTLPDVRPQFVLVGPQEEGSFAPIITRPNWDLVGQSGPYFLYKPT